MSRSLHDTTVNRLPFADLSMGVERKMNTSLLSIARALSSPTRLLVLQSLGESGMNVTEAARRAGLATSTTCFHLAVLLDAGLVERKRKGRTCIYRWGATRCSIHFEPAPPTTSTTA